MEWFLEKDRFSNYVYRNIGRVFYKQLTLLHQILSVRLNYICMYLMKYICT